MPFIYCIGEFSTRQPIFFLQKKIDDCVSQKTTLEIQRAADQEKFDKALESANVDTKELQGQKNQLGTKLNSSQNGENEKEAKYQVFFY